MQSYDIPLHDIKPLVEVEEYSLYYLLGTIGIALFLSLLLAYGVYYLYKRSKRINLRVLHKESFHNLDLNDTKNAAYALSQYGLIFKDDSEEHAKVFSDLTLHLEEYKYRKSVSEFDSSVLDSIEKYKALLNA